MKKLLLLSFVLYCVACSNDNVEKITPKSLVIDTSNVTFNGTIVPLLQKYQCYSCHAEKVASALADGIKLSPYNNIKIYVDNGMFYGAITHDPDYEPMPQGGTKMSDNDIAVIKFWINKGAPDN